MPLSKEFLLTLLKTPRLGPVSVRIINANADSYVNTINDLYELILYSKKQNSKISVPTVEDLLKGYGAAQLILNECENDEIKVITVNDSLYPIKFFRLPDNPLVIYVKGSIEAVNAPLTAAVIGTREPSSFGVKAGRRISTVLAKNGYSIISGLAIGCDTVGHLGALDARAPTVAVLASGFNHIYPKENIPLVLKILNTGGALLSEYEPNFRPQRSTFVERDRLQSGLSDGVVVVETDVNGGTMHAVKAAKAMNIPVGCISNHPENLKDFPKARGNKLLIDTGAFPLGNSEQIFEFVRKMNPKVESFVNDEKVKDQSVSTKNEEVPIESERIREWIRPDIFQYPIYDEKSITESNSQSKDSISKDLAEIKELLYKLLKEQENIKEALQLSDSVRKATKSSKTDVVVKATKNTKKKEQPKLS